MLPLGYDALLGPARTPVGRTRAPGRRYGSRTATLMVAPGSRNEAIASARSMPGRADHRREARVDRRRRRPPASVARSAGAARKIGSGLRHRGTRSRPRESPRISVRPGSPSISQRSSCTCFRAARPVVFHSRQCVSARKPSILSSKRYSLLSNGLGFRINCAGVNCGRRTSISV